MSFLPPIQLPVHTPLQSTRSPNFPSTRAYASSYAASSPNSLWNAHSRAPSTLTIPSIIVPPSESNHQTTNAYPYIGKGSFWTVYSNKNNPSSVIRVGKSNGQKNRNVRATAKRKSNQILSIIKNNRTPNQEISFNELPNNLQKVFKKQKQTIQAIRTPYLGVDLLTYIEQLPPYTSHDVILPELLTQIHSLLRQTFLLSKQRMCHGDIHLTNIMIHPDTLQLRLIDFDLLNTYEHTMERLNTNSAIQTWIPPEYIPTHLSNRYVNKLYDTYKEYYTCHHITKDILSLVVAHSMKVNQGVAPSISHYDNFGLSMSLLYLLTVLYHPCSESSAEMNTIHRNITELDKQSNPVTNTSRELERLNQTKRTLKLKMNVVNHPTNENRNTLIQLNKQRAPLLKRSMKESNERQKGIAAKKDKLEERAFSMFFTPSTTPDNALYNTIGLLKQLCDFRIQSRISPAEAYQRMTDILLALFANDSDKSRSIRELYEEDTRKSGGKKRTTRRRKRV